MKQLLLAACLLVWSVSAVAADGPRIELLKRLDTAELRDWIDGIPQFARTQVMSTHRVLQHVALKEHQLTWLSVGIEVPAGEQWEFSGGGAVEVTAMNRGTPLKLPSQALLVIRDGDMNKWDDSRRGAATLAGKAKAPRRFRGLVAVAPADRSLEFLTCSPNPDHWRLRCAR